MSVGKKFKHEVMSELLENLVPGILPHYFVILTLANFAQADGKSNEKLLCICSFINFTTIQKHYKIITNKHCKKTEQHLGMVEGIVNRACKSPM